MCFALIPASSTRPRGTEEMSSRLLLSETGGDAGQVVASRICDRVERDGELPPISASVGVAVYGQGGQTLEALIRTADQALYRAKRRPSAKLLVVT